MEDKYLYYINCEYCKRVFNTHKPFGTCCYTCKIMKKVSNKYKNLLTKLGKN